VTYEVVDKIQTFRDILDGKIDREDIIVIDFEKGEIWGTEDIVLGDLDREKVIFIKMTCD